MEKKNGNYHVIVGYILGCYWGYIGIMEKKSSCTCRLKGQDTDYEDVSGGLWIKAHCFR